MLHIWLCSKVVLLDSETHCSLGPLLLHLTLVLWMLPAASPQSMSFQLSGFRQPSSSGPAGPMLQPLDWCLWGREAPTHLPWAQYFFHNSTLIFHSSSLPLLASHVCDRLMYMKALQRKKSSLLYTVCLQSPASNKCTSEKQTVNTQMPFYFWDYLLESFEVWLVSFKKWHIALAHSPLFSLFSLLLLDCFFFPFSFSSPRLSLLQWDPISSSLSRLEIFCSFSSSSTFEEISEKPRAPVTMLMVPDLELKSFFCHKTDTWIGTEK